ncbi:MAG: flagellar basal-body rod protein FlgG [Planctomycetales bacterium]|nr:flagellar basal-body rod protein FlgG [Planctomycetales bacterium]
MIRALYSSASGMKAQETMLDVTANNLANVNTNGFKRSNVDFADLLYNTIRAPGANLTAGQSAPVGLEIGSGARAMSTTKLFTPGTIELTGNATDMAIQGDGFFQVELANGEVRYTRDGAFHRDQDGTLVTADGAILTPQISIPSDASNINIGEYGNVSYTQNGVTQDAGVIQLVNFANPAGLSSEGGNLLAETQASGNPLAGDPGTQGLGTILGKYLERSNVEVVTELVSLITAQRAYEVNARAIRAGDEMLSNTAQIVR